MRKMKEQILNRVYAKTTKAFADLGAHPLEGGNRNGVQRAALLRGVFGKAYHNRTSTYAPLGARIGLAGKLRRDRLRAGGVRLTA